MTHVIHNDRRSPHPVGSDGPTLRVVVRFDAEVAVISLNGELNANKVDEVRRIGRCALAVGATSILLDGQLAIAVSGALDEIASELTALCADRDGSVTLVEPGGRLRRVPPAELSIEPGRPNWPRPQAH